MGFLVKKIFFCLKKLVFLGNIISFIVFLNLRKKKKLVLMRVCCIFFNEYIFIYLMWVFCFFMYMYVYSSVINS